MEISAARPPLPKAAVAFNVFNAETILGVAAAVAAKTVRAKSRWAMRGRMGLVIEEHEAILDAIADHDPKRAVQALVAHLNDLQVTIAEAQKANPLYFTDRKTN